MFRDLKEYQEIAKLYVEKVSKKEDIEENRNTRGQALRMQREKNKPKTREEVGLKPIEKKPFVGSRSRFMNKKTEVKKEPEYKPVKGVVFGQRTNEVGALGGGKPSSVPVEKSKPEVSTKTKQGKPRTKAQMMAAKRIASGKSIQDVKDANTKSMQDRARAKNTEFQAAKKSGNLKQFRKDNPKMSGADRAKAMAKARLAKKAEMSEGIIDDAKETAVNTVKKGVKAVANKAGSVGKMVKNTAVKVAKEVKKGYDAQEEYTPYDIVLEYLLSTEQVATIEEANYVMTEMDAETIQGIVEEQKKNIEEGLPLLAKGAMVVGGAILAKKGLDKAKKSFDNYIDNERDKPGGGNTRPGADKIYFGDKKKK